MKDKMNIKGIISIQLKDKDGNLKKLFKQNFLGKFFQKVLSLDLKIPVLMGGFVNELSFHNLITTAGKGEATNLMGNVSSPAAFTYLAIGTGVSGPAAGDTTLGTELTTDSLGRAAATVTRQQTTTANDTLQLLKQWTAGGAHAVTECGIFNNASAGSGVLLGRQVFSAVNVAATDTIQITYKIALS